MDTATAEMLEATRLFQAALGQAMPQDQGERVAQGRDVVRDVSKLAHLGQDILGRNILNYKAANTAFVDAAYVSKLLGVADTVMEKLAPFPTSNRVSVNQNIGLQPDQSEQPPAPAPTPQPAPRPSTGGEQPDTPSEPAKPGLLTGWKKWAAAAALLGAGLAANPVGKAIWGPKEDTRPDNGRQTAPAQSGGPDASLEVEVY
jgi:hypothetical protein